MDYINIILLVFIGIGAGFVQRVTGFGLGIFAMLFLPHFMPSQMAAAAVSCLFSCGTSTYNTIRYRKNIPFRTILPLICTAIIMIPISVHFAGVLPERGMKILLAGILIILSIYFLFFSKRIRIKPTIANGLIVGALGGTLNGMFSTGGPPIVLYLTQAVSDKLSYFAAIQFYFSLTNIYATAVRAYNGIITREILLYALIGFIGCMVGDFIGRKVFNKLNAEKLRHIIYIGMIISGILMIF